MSVINKMLRDLEARRAAPTTAPDGVHATAVPRHNGRMLAMLLLGGAAAGAAAFGDWPALLAAKAEPIPAPLQMAQNDDPPASTILAASTNEVGNAAATVAVSIPEAPSVPALSPRTSAPNLPARPADPIPKTRPLSVRPADIAPTATTGGLAASASQARPTQLALASLAAQPGGAATIDKRMAVLPSAQRAQALYQQGLDLVATGHGRQAVEQLQAALKLDPRLVAARIHTVSLLLEQSRGAEAEALARDGLSLSADEPQLAALLARVLADRGDTTDALAVLNRSGRLSAEGFGLRAGLLSQQGEFSRALSDYEQAVRLQPGNSLWWLGLGVALEAEGRSQQARQVYGRAQAIGMERSELNTFIEQKLQQLE